MDCHTPLFVSCFAIFRKISWTCFTRIVHSVIQKSNIWPGQSIQIVILICVRMCKKKRGFYPSMTDGEDDKIAD